MPKGASHAFHRAATPVLHARWCDAERRRRPEKGVVGRVRRVAARVAARFLAQGAYLAAQRHPTHRAGSDKAKRASGEPLAEGQ